MTDEFPWFRCQRAFFTGARTDYCSRALLPQTVSADERMTRFVANIQRVRDRVWGTAAD